MLEPKLTVRLHTNEDFMLAPDAPQRQPLGNRVLSEVEQAGTPEGLEMAKTEAGWEFAVEGTGFKARLRVELDAVPEAGVPTPLTPGSIAALASSAASADVPVSPP